jgi:hypothetical protein
MAGGADGDQAIQIVAAGLAVVDGQPFPAPAGLALSAVAMERRLALAREAPAGMRAARVAAAADPGNGRQVAAGAEERALRRKSQKSSIQPILLAGRRFIISGFPGMWRNCALTSKRTLLPIGQPS